MKTPEERKAYKAAWYLANKERLSVVYAKRYIENRDEVLAKAAQYKKDHRAELAVKQREYNAKTRPVRLERQRDYRIANPNKFNDWAAQNRDVLLAKKSARKKANPAQNAAHAAAYHAAKLQRVVPFTDMVEVAKVYAEAARQRAAGGGRHGRAARWVWRAPHPLSVRWREPVYGGFVGCPAARGLEHRVLEHRVVCSTWENFLS